MFPPCKQRVCRPLSCIAFGKSHGETRTLKSTWSRIDEICMIDDGVWKNYFTHFASTIGIEKRFQLYTSWLLHRMNMWSRGEFKVCPDDGSLGMESCHVLHLGTKFSPPSLKSNPWLYSFTKAFFPPEKLSTVVSTRKEWRKRNILRSSKPDCRWDSVDAINSALVSPLSKIFRSCFLINLLILSNSHKFQNHGQKSSIHSIKGGAGIRLRD